jgi:hypothetical protein
VERRRSHRGGGLERHVGEVLTVASPRYVSVIIAAAVDGCAQQECGLELATSNSPYSRDQRTVRPRVAPSRTGTSESQRATPSQADPPRRSEERSARVPQLFDGSDHTDSDSLQRRRSRARSTDSATPSVPQAVDSGASPRRLQSLLIRGGGAPNVHVSLIAGGGQGSTPTVAEARGSAPKRSRERSAAVEVADRSGAAPELADSKRAAPEQGSSGHLVKKSRVHSKM